MNLYGIDTGKKTGIALWDSKARNLTLVKTTTILQAMDIIKADPEPKQIYFEDARKRKWFGNSGREKLQGAGSVKRDASIWQEFCEMHGIEYTPVAPMANNTKLNGEDFQNITKFTGRTSEHGRDAAMLVFGR